MRQIVFASLFLFLLSCNKGPGFLTKYGETVDIFRNLGDFSVVDVGQKFDLYLLQDSSKPQGITITYGNNLISKISTNISEGVLEIRDQNHFNWVRDLKVNPKCTLNVYSISALFIGGSASVICLDTIKTLKLNILQNSSSPQYLTLSVGQLTGGIENSGHVIFKGEGTIFAWSCEDGGWFDASAMHSADAYIFQYCDRDCFVNADKVLVAKIFSNGNLYYLSEPSVKKEIYELGSGRVLKK